MSANAPASTPLSRIVHFTKPLLLLGVVAVIALAAWIAGTWVAAASPSSTTAITSALRLAAGTLQLEGTAHQVDAASASKLLPLWQLLAQLQRSGSAAPEEITAVVDEIKLNMTSAQLSAIDAMSISEAGLGSGADPAASAKSGATQVASAASDPMLGGDMPAGAGPMDGGGPMPFANAQGAASSASSGSPVPSVLNRVIQLLETKVQG